MGINLNNTVLKNEIIRS